MRVTVVVPCYNEAQRLDPRPFEAWVGGAPDRRLLFVNDGSTDDTLVVLREFPGSVHSLAENRGKAEAVRAGMALAMDGGCDVIGVWDSDLSASLDELAPMQARMEARPELQVVLGSRVAMLGYDIRRSPLRHYVGRLFATAASLTLDLPVYDTQCGAKLWRVSDALQASLQEPFLGPWTYDVELMARVLGAVNGDGRTVFEEVPLRRWHHEDGSKVRPLDLFRALLNLWRIRRRYPQLTASSARTSIR